LAAAVPLRFGTRAGLASEQPLPAAVGDPTAAQNAEAECERNRLQQGSFTEQLAGSRS